MISTLKYNDFYLSVRILSCNFAHRKKNMLEYFMISYSKNKETKEYAIKGRMNQKNKANKQIKRII